MNEVEVFRTKEISKLIEFEMLKVPVIKNLMDRASIIGYLEKTVLDKEDFEVVYLFISADSEERSIGIEKLISKIISSDSEVI